MNTVLIGEREYPIYCDLYVLSKIQDKMSINQFERDILGAVIERDEEGEPIRDEKGHIRLVFDKYNIETVLFGLTLMINEGLEIKAEQEESEQEKITEKEIARTCRLPIEKLTEILHTEFLNCLGSKKKEPAKSTSRKRST